MLLKGDVGLKRRLAALRERAEDVDRALLKAGLLIAAQAQRNVTGGGRSTTMLNVRTGRLRRSIVAVPDGQHRVSIGTNVEYAAIHEFGGMAGRNRSVRLRMRTYLRKAYRSERRGALELVRDFYTGPLRFGGSFA